MSHVDFMICLTKLLAEEEQTQDQIDETRMRNANDSLAQLKLDRHQAVVDERRQNIRETMLNIASQN